MTTQQQVIETIAEAAAWSPEFVSAELNLADDLWLNSDDRLFAAVLVEEKFDISIPDEAVASWRTVQDVIETVNYLKTA